MNADQAKFLAGVIGQNLQGEWMHTYKAINAVNDAQEGLQAGRQLAHRHGTSRITSPSATSASCRPSQTTASPSFPAKCDAKTIPGARRLVQARDAEGAREGAHARRQSSRPDRRVVGHEAAVGDAT